VKTKWFVILAGLALVSLLIVSCAPAAAPAPAPEEPAPEEEVIHATYNMILGRDTGHGQQIARMVDKIEALTNHRLDIDVYYASSLYELVDQMSMLSQGVVQFAEICNYFWPIAEDCMNITWCPYLISPSKAVTMKFVDSDAMWNLKNTLMVEKYNAHSLPDLGWIGTNPTFFNRDFPLNTLDDFKGRKFGCFMYHEASMAEAFGGMGLMTTPAKQYMQLQTGMIDGTIAAATPNVKFFGLAEFAKYRYYPSIYHNAAMTIVNQDFWESLPEDIREAVTEAALDKREFAKENIRYIQDGYIEFAKETCGQEGYVMPKEVFFPLLDWSVENVWKDLYLRCQPEYKAVWDETAKIMGFTIEETADGVEFHGVKEAWEPIYDEIGDDWYKYEDPEFVPKSLKEMWAEKGI